MAVMGTTVARHADDWEICRTWRAEHGTMAVDCDRRGRKQSDSTATLDMVMVFDARCRIDGIRLIQYGI